MRWESRGNFRPTPTGLVANLSSARMRAYTAIYWNPGRLVDYGNARTAADIINVFGPTSNRPGSLDDTLYLSLTDRDGSVSSAATVGNGSRQGQHLQIRNESPDADVYTFLAYGVSLAPGATALLVWAGSTWRLQAISPVVERVTSGLSYTSKIKQLGTILWDVVTGGTLLLDPSPVEGARLTIKDQAGTSALHPVTISGNGKTIDGLASIALAANFGSIDLLFDSSEWHVL